MPDLECGAHEKNDGNTSLTLSGSRNAAGAPSSCHPIPGLPHMQHPGPKYKSARCSRMPRQLVGQPQKGIPALKVDATSVSTSRSKPARNSSGRREVPAAGRRRPTIDANPWPANLAWRMAQQQRSRTWKRAPSGKRSFTEHENDATAARRRQMTSIWKERTIETARAEASFHTPLDTHTHDARQEADNKEVSGAPPGQPAEPDAPGLPGRWCPRDWLCALRRVARSQRIQSAETSYDGQQAPPITKTSQEHYRTSLS